MDSTTQEVITFIEENDVKFIRLAFCDVLGRQKNISVMPSQITRVFEDGISFDAAAVLGFKGIAEFVFISGCNNSGYFALASSGGKSYPFFL